MSPKKLKEQILPPDAENIYVRMLVDNKLVGNVFATRWNFQGLQALWITQLCVSNAHRNQCIAKQLLTAVHKETDRKIGILSSHPFAIAAVLRVFGGGLERSYYSLERMNSMMESCPVGYVRNAKPRFDVNGAVSCADTQFWVDHGEPLDALQTLEGQGRIWPFGRLPGGHEFLVLMNRDDAGETLPP
jgi:hypothetical protein